MSHLAPILWTFLACNRIEHAPPTLQHWTKEKTKPKKQNKTFLCRQCGTGAPRLESTVCPARLARGQQSPLAPRPWLRECLRSHGTPQNRLLLAASRQPASWRKERRWWWRWWWGGRRTGDSEGQDPAWHTREWGMAHLLHVGLTEKVGCGEAARRLNDTRRVADSCLKFPELGFKGFKNGLLWKTSSHSWYRNFTRRTSQIACLICFRAKCTSVHSVVVSFGFHQLVFVHLLNLQIIHVWVYKYVYIYNTSQRFSHTLWI